MKSFSLLLLLVFSQSTFAKGIKEFNYKLLEEVQKDIKKDPDTRFRKASTLNRGPASVPTQSSDGPIQEENKIDKMNIRQIGPNKW